MNEVEVTHLSTLKSNTGETYACFIYKSLDRQTLIFGENREALENLRSALELAKPVLIHLHGTPNLPETLDRLKDLITPVSLPREPQQCNQGKTAHGSADPSA